MRKWRQLAVGVVFVTSLSWSAAEAADTVRIGGDLEIEAQVDLDSPSEVRWHNRLRLTLEQSLGAARLRVDGDMEALEPQGVAETEITEATITLDSGDWRWVAGRQTVEWGSGVSINPTSVVNPVRPADGEPEAVPTNLLSTTYYMSPEWSFTSVWIPQFTPAPVPARPDPPSGPRPEIRPPSSTLEESEWALRATWRPFGFDLSGVVFRGWEDRPVSSPSGTYLKFPRTTTVGVDWLASVGDVGVWVEGAYSMFDDVDEGVFQGVAGLDYTTLGGLHMLAEVHHLGDERHDRRDVNNLLVAVERDFAMIHSWRLGASYDLDGGGYRLMPEVEYSLGDGTALTLSAFYTDEESRTTASPEKADPMRVNDQVRIALSTYF